MNYASGTMRYVPILYPTSACAASLAFNEDALIEKAKKYEDDMREEERPMLSHFRTDGIRST